MSFEFDKESGSYVCTECNKIKGEDMAGCASCSQDDNFLDEE